MPTGFAWGVTCRSRLEGTAGDTWPSTSTPCPQMRWRRSCRSRTAHGRGGEDVLAGVRDRKPVLGAGLTAMLPDEPISLRQTADRRARPVAKGTMTRAVADRIDISIEPEHSGAVDERQTPPEHLPSCGSH